MPGVKDFEAVHLERSFEHDIMVGVE